MTSFLAIGNYSPLMVLAIGLATFAGFWGTGAALLHAIRGHIPSPWRPVVAVLLGIQAVSLAVQIAGMAELASRQVLDAMWLAMMAIGLVMLILSNQQRLIEFFRNLKKLAPSFSIGVVEIPIAIIGIAVGTDLLIALAPSSKIDELYYHMLVPSRIVADGALHFYRLPWEGAIWPQMAYQIAAAPIDAIGYPDAANVVSWGLSTILLWFAWRLMRDSTKTALWAALWTGSLCVGLYPAVWSVTAGSHAMGDVAMATAIAAFCARDRLLTALSPPAYAAMFSLLVLSAATSKISLLPLSAVLLCTEAWLLARSAPLKATPAIVAAIVVPWVIFYCPIALWTWVQSGSPFGPVLAGSMSHSVYAVDWVQKSFQQTRHINQTPLITVVEYIAVNYSPLIWLGVIGALVGTNLPNSMRGFLACLFALQVTLIYWLLPHDARFLGGLQYGLVIIFGCFAKSDLQIRFGSARAVGTACVVFLVPWLGIQIYYATQFFPVSLGLEKTAFYERYIAFYADYVKLNRMISKDTVILVQGFRLDSGLRSAARIFRSGRSATGKTGRVVRAFSNRRCRLANRRIYSWRSCI